MATALQTWMTANPSETDGSLSKKVGVSRVQILRIRQGKNRPGRETALKLEKATGIPASVLLFQELEDAA